MKAGGTMAHLNGQIKKITAISKMLKDERVEATQENRRILALVGGLGELIQGTSNPNKYKIKLQNIFN